MSLAAAPSANTLKAQQQALVSALFALPSETATHASLRHQLNQNDAQCHRGLQAYQANGHALAKSSLRSAFPVVEQMLGTTNFEALACDFWHRHPPEQGDLARWGAALPAFLASNAQLTDAPYLSDVAKVEWALHRAAFEGDIAPDPASFARLTNEGPETLALTMAPGVSTVVSRFPVVSLVLAHLQSQPSLAEAADRLRKGQHETALIWRQGMKPNLMPCSPQAAALVAHMQSGIDLASALDRALATATATATANSNCDSDSDSGDEQAFDFSEWLSEAVTQGVVIGVHTAHIPAA